MVSGSCGRISASLSPAATPRAASALASRLASRHRSQYVCAERAPFSSSQYTQKRVRSAAQRPQQAAAMLKRAGTFQRCAAKTSAYRSTLIVDATSRLALEAAGDGGRARRGGAELERLDRGPHPFGLLL